MGTREIDHLIERLAHDRGSLVAGGTPPAEIARLEAQLGVMLPPSYKRLLARFDGGDLAFGRLYCITPSGAGFFDFRDELEAFCDDFPEAEGALLPFARGHGGELQCFDLRAGMVEPPIVLLEGDDPEPVAGSLAEWIACTYDEFARSPTNPLVLIGAPADLARHAPEGVSLEPVWYGAAALRLHFEGAPPVVSSVRFSDGIDAIRPGSRKTVAENGPALARLSTFIDQALAAVRAPIELLAYDDGELSALPQYRTVFGPLRLGAGTHLLTAGDRLRLTPDGAFTLVRRPPFGNFVRG